MENYYKINRWFRHYMRDFNTPYSVINWANWQMSDGSMGIHFITPLLQAELYDGIY